MDGGHTTTGVPRANSFTGPLAGPGAGALKYDLLTALLVAASHTDATTARLTSRLALLITARYNWHRQRFSVGRREIARMWGVTERTAKRDMAEMRARGWISVVVPAARGRVAQHEIHMQRLLAVTRPYWTAVGPDFAARMTPQEPVAISNVVPLTRANKVSKPANLSEEECGVWAVACADLDRDDPAVYAAWFATLVPGGQKEGVFTLYAGNRFQATYIMQHHKDRLLRALQDHAERDGAGPIQGVRVVATGA